MELRALAPENQSTKETKPEPQGFIVIPEQEKSEAKQRCRLATWLRRLAGAAGFALFLSGLGAAAYIILSIS
jgi:hypothetical protein